MSPTLWLYHLSDRSVLAGVLGVVIACALLAPYAGRFLMRSPMTDARDAAAFDAFKVVMGMAGALLAFSLVQAVGNRRATEGLVGREAAAFATVDRALLRFGSADAVAMRPLVAEYGRARIDLEWPGLTEGERDTATDDRYNALSRTARSLQPADGRQQSTYAELLRSLDDLAEMRELTLQNGDVDLPDLFWLAAFGQLALALALAGLTRPAPARLAAIGAMAAALGLVLSLLVIVDHPFGGETGVTPAPISKVLAVNARRV